MDNKEYTNFLFSIVSSLDKLFDVLGVDKGNRITLRNEFAKNMGETMGMLKMKQVEHELKEVKNG